VILGELVDRLLGREVETSSEDLAAFHCSELVAAAFEEAGTVSEINASDVSPKDLCSWAIYEQDYYYVDSDQSGPEIPSFNTLDPSANWEGLILESYQEVHAFQPQLPLPTWSGSSTLGSG
jgi:hypothetical protein